jgi:hypothetical protein
VKFHDQIHYSLAIQKREFSDPTPSIYVKFQDQNHYSLAIQKREISDIYVRLDLSEILYFYWYFVPMILILKCYI